MMQPLRTIVVDMMICHLECLHLLLESFYRNLAKYGNMSQEKPSRFLATRIFTDMQYASVKALGGFSLVKFTVQKRVLRPGLRLSEILHCDFCFSMKFLTETKK